MKRNLLLALSGLVLLALGIGCRHHEPNPVSTENLPSAPVTVHRLEARETELIEETVGTVRSKRHARIEAKVSGRVLEVLVVVGQTVRAGEVLVRLEVSETRARLEQARAVDEQARSDFRRLASLLERQAATPAEFESIQARARAAAAAVKELESLAGNGEIAAPFDAVVTSKSVETGDLAMPGKPLIELEDPQTMRLEVQVGESLIRHLQPGLALPVRAPSWDGAGARGGERNLASRGSGQQNPPREAGSSIDPQAPIRGLCARGSARGQGEIASSAQRGCDSARSAGAGVRGCGGTRPAAPREKRSCEWR
jgi:multidrug efflux pump subunit AcrA (membrane-fusion protein)